MDGHTPTTDLLIQIFIPFHRQLDIVARLLSGLSLDERFGIREGFRCDGYL